jgi:arylformamidase
MTPSPELIDISRPLTAATACWPGDVPFAFRLGWKIADGASVNVGAVETSVHTATHCDAAFHYDDAGATVDRLPLDVFVGPCWVVDVRGVEDWLSRLSKLDAAHTSVSQPGTFYRLLRVLFRTGGWPDTNRFPDAIPAMTPEAADALGSLGVKLIGVDLPSVDPLDSKTLAVHHKLGRHGVTILEGLWLEDVPEGRYELIALPLRIVGADGSPVRAALRRLPDSPRL